VESKRLGYGVKQCGPTTGPRAACCPPQRFQWPTEAFRKSSNFKFVEKRVRLYLSHWIACAG